MPRIDLEFFPKTEQHVIFILDLSANANPEYIRYLNSAMDAAAHILSEVEKMAADDIFKISVLGYNEAPQWLFSTPVYAQNFSWPCLYTSGEANFSAALDEFNDKLNRKDLLKTEEAPIHPPVIVFIGHSTPSSCDDSIYELQHNTWYMAATKLGILIDNHSAFNTYQELLGGMESVISIKEASALEALLTRLSELIIPNLTENYVAHSSTHEIRKMLRTELNLALSSHYEELDSKKSNSEKEPSITVPVLDENISYGKAKCKLLKTIRKSVADANGIPYEITECPSTDPCSGTCPRCDAEALELSNQLSKLALSGKQIHMPTMDTDLLDNYLPAKTVDNTVVDIPDGLMGEAWPVEPLPGQAGDDYFNDPDICGDWGEW